MMSLDLQVPDFRDTGTHIEYRIVLIVNGEKKGHVWRRFRVLDSVFRSLRHRYQELGPPPPRVVTFFSAMTPAKIIDRRDHIQAYLKTVLKHPVACCDPQFQHVVGVQQATTRHVFTYATNLLVSSRNVQIMCCCFMRLLLNRNRLKNGVTPKQKTITEHSVGCQTTDLDAELEELVRLQSEVKVATERAVAAELLVSTMKFNKDSQMTNACVFLPGTPPDHSIGGGGSFFVDSPDAMSTLTNRSFRATSSRLAPHNPCATVGRSWVDLIKKISIPRYEYKKDEFKKEVLHYSVHIATTRHESWSVWRRYNAFCSFKQQLSDAGCSSVTSGFPQRISLGGIDARRSALECWLESARLASGGDSKQLDILLTSFLSPNEDDGDYISSNLTFQEMHQQLAPQFPGG